MPNYTYTKIARKTHPPYDIQMVESAAAYNLVTYRDDIEEIHVTIPPADDIRPNQAWSYPHITFVRSDGVRDHVYIGWGKNKSQVPVDSKGGRMILSASEFTLFNNIVDDMNAKYSYL
ncbi:MAG: hypothetical protein KF866_08975 [Phycisphaeraceae bacterium]|nr:hypothetical protein [Phycisphaeraceae bacterium]